jgi:hypothetical protein
MVRSARVLPTPQASSGVFHSDDSRIGRSSSSSRYEEGFFAKLTRRRLKRGVFRSLNDLKAAINRFVAETNAVFVWTADPQRVLAAVKRGKQALESVH